MKNTTSKTAVWSPVDLRNYLARIVNAYKEDEHWPHILTILTNGLETGDPVPLGTASHPPTPEMTCRVQAIPSAAKKAPVQTNVTTANTLMTPVGSVRVAPPVVSGSQPLPQATEEERE